jgi:hypothetical protein
MSKHDRSQSKTQQDKMFVWNKVAYDSDLPVYNTLASLGSHRAKANLDGAVYKQMLELG